MDIEILLWFQNIRFYLGPLVATIMTFLSDWLCYIAVVAPFVVYWVKSKKAGAFLISTYGISLLINQFLKCTFVVDRPWVKDARIQPPEGAKVGATGYSFPSNHTQTNAAIDGGVIRYCKKKGWIIFHVCIIIFMALSRVYLGVHTPLDVIVGVIVGVASIYLALAYEKRTENNPKAQKTFLIIFFVLAALCFVYAEFKSYPMTYVEGELLVDPVTMKKDSLRSIGAFIGMFLGLYLESKYVHFSTDGTTKEKVLRTIIGLIGVGILFGISRGLIVKLVPTEISRFIETFMLVAYATYLYPLFILVKISKSF